MRTGATGLFDRRAVMAGLGAAAATPAFAQTRPPLRAPTAVEIAALAPRGRLKAATNAGNRVLATKDPKTGEVTGVTVDISRELARRLGVPLEVIFYTDGSQELPGMYTDHWDVILLGIDPSREGQLAFAAPYLLLETTYLVKADAPFKTAAEVDREGVRISSGASSAYDMVLTRVAKHATIVRAPTTAAAQADYLKGGFDALSGVRQGLDDIAKAHAGYRVLPGSIGDIAQGVGIPHASEAGLGYLKAFVEEIKANGFVRASLDSHGQTDAIVAPPA